MRLLAHLAGDVPAMAAAEFRAVFEAHGAPVTTLREAPQFLDGHSDVSLEAAARLLPRLGLTHVAALHLFDGAPGTWPEAAQTCPLPTDRTFAVRAVRVDAAAPWASPDVERDVGAVLATGRRVDLRHPEVLARAFLLADRVYVGQELWASDPKEARQRHVEHRPFSTPVSLEPRLARALVNLAHVRAGDTFWDPFCGTGGLLLEASALGARAFGSDLDPAMVEGSRENLRHYGLAGDVFRADVGDSSEKLKAVGVELVDAVASDLPYGRSASTGKESRQLLYGRAFSTVARVLRPGGRAVLGVPDEASVAAAGAHLETVAVHAIRAHKSLTRHFVVVRRRA